MKHLIKNLLLVSLFSTLLFSQTIPDNKHGLKVINSIDLYELTVSSDSNNLIVDLEEYILSIVLDIKYATEDNFTGKILYPYPKAFLRLPAAKALKKAQEEFKQLGYGIKVFDAYRPYDVTEMMWEFVKDPRYVAEPWKGSRHNRGCAVDITLIDLETMQEIAMPTPYDDFTNKAHLNYSNLPSDVLKNRQLLVETMAKYGFTALSSEWWHYDFNGWNKYALMNLSFDQLSALNAE